MIEKMILWLRSYVNNEGCVAFDEQTEVDAMVKDITKNGIPVYVWFKPFLSKHVVGGVCTSHDNAVRELKNFLSKQEEAFHYTFHVDDYDFFVEKYMIKENK